MQRAGRSGWRTRALLAFVATCLLVLIQASSAHAAASLTATPVTWNIIGLDSNNVTTGPNTFLVGARICNTGDQTATNVASAFVWDSTNANINLSGATSQTVGTGSLAPGACYDVYYTVVITRTSAAYNTARRYYITATASGGLTASTPTPREVYVEKLVSQNRNSVTSITGPSTVYVGQQYTYTVVADTAPGGYAQLEAFTVFNNLIYRIDSISTTYTAPSGATNDKLYADACGWDNNPASGTYRSCIGPANYPGGKAGGTITTVYTVTVLSPGSASLGTLIFDFSGSSYHYNSDLNNPLTTISTTALPAADLVMSKSVTSPASGPYLNGQNLTYTLNVANNGPNTAVAPVITDDLPTGVNYVSSSAGCSYVALTRRLTCTLADLASGANTSATVTVTPTSAGSLANTASVASSTTDLVPANNTSTDTTTIVPAANLAIAKSVTSPASDPYYNGEDLTYTLTVTNAGPNTAVSPTITDTLPAGVSFVSGSSGCSHSSGTVTCTLASIASGGSATATITVTATTAGTVTNTASVASTTADPSSSDNTTSIDTTITPAADVAVAKSVNTATPAMGANVTFTVTVTNNGPDPAQTVAVADALPSGLTLVSATPSTGSYSAGPGSWTVGSLASGATETLSIVATVTSEVAITNSATASSSTHDPDASNNSASATVNVPDADLEVAKTVDVATPAVGSDVVFTVSVTNNGPDDATSVVVGDLLPSGLTLVSATPSQGSYAGGVWTVGTVESGATKTLQLRATVTTHTSQTNTASVTSSGLYDPTTTNNSASVSVDTVDADVAVSKSVDTATPAMGANVTFTVTVTNNGPDTAAGVSVADALPSGLSLVSATPSTGTYSAATGTWTVGALANGATATLSIVATVTSELAITNTAGVSSTTYDPTSSNNSASVSVNVPDADLAVAKTVDNATPALGGDVTFTVTVTNNGPDTAAGVSVADALPSGLTLVSATPSTGSYASGTWTVGSLANSASATLAIVATVTSHTNITNTATASATTYDPDTSNNAQSVSVNVPDANIAVTKVVDNATPALGGNVTFTVSVTNNGPDIATNVSVADALPSGLTLVSATPSIGTYSAGTWTVGNVASGVTRTLAIVATVTTHTNITNTATGSTSTYDPDTSNDAQSVSVNVPDANLALTKVVDNATPALGGNVTFTVSVTNNGPDTAANVSVADALPSGLTLVSATPSAGSYASGTWTIGSLASGASATLAIVATVTTHTNITNTATVSSTTYDPTSANDSALAAVDVPDANLAVTKTVDSATPALGGNVTFTVSVTNNGPDTAANVSVADALPSGLALVSATPSVGSYASGTWTVGSLANGASETLAIVATVMTHTSVTNTATATTTTHDPAAGNDTAAAQVDAPDADLQVTKTVNNAQPEVGDNVTFTVTVTNNGPDGATGVSVADTLPAGLTLVSATPSSGSYASGVWTVGGLANGGSATLAVVATVNVTSTITNTATVSGDPYDPTSGNNSAAVSVNALQADIEVTKTVDNATPALGANVTFTVTARNNGPNAATGVTVGDILPGGLTLVSATPTAGTYSGGAWTLGTVANGAAPTLQIVATVTSLTGVTNTATATATTYDPTPGNNSASAGVDVPNADLAISKVVSNATPTVGSAVTFTVTVTNNGPDTATGVEVADALPGGLTFVSATPSAGSYTAGVWTVGNVPSGAMHTLDIVATVATHTAVTNTATVSATTADQTPGNNSDSAAVDAPDADLAVTKTVDNAAPVVGANVTYTVSVTNNGPDASSDVEVADALPTGLTLVSATPSSGTYASGVWTVGSVGNGVTRTLTIVATVTAPTAITNTASATATTHDPSPGNNTSSVVIDAPDADLAVTKTVSNGAPTLGSDVTFTVTVTNNGPDAASAVQVADTLPGGLTLVSATPSTGSYSSGVWTIGVLANGGTATLTVVATVTSHLSQLNTATATSSTHDPISANNSDSATVNVPDADVSVAKSVDNATPALGSDVTFTISVANGGPDTATGVVVTDVLPAGLTIVSATPSTGLWVGATGTWSVGNVASGATPSLVIVATVTAHTAMTNTASVTATTFDPDSANNSASAVVDVREADLQVSKSVDNATPSVGEDVVFTVTVTNAGADAATGVQVADALPSGLTLVSAVPSAGSYAAGVWSVGAMPSGATRTLTVTATVTSHLALTNTATASSATYDPVPGNNAASAAVDARDADLAVTKTVDNASPAFGANVTFTVGVTNNGPDTASGVVVADVLPAGLSLVSSSATVGAYAAGAWTIGSLASGAGGTLTIVATVTDDAPITNTATATSTTHDPDSANNAASVPLDVPNADVAVTKSVDNVTPALGANVTFTVTVTNNGPQAAAAVSVTDALPSGVVLVTATPSAGTYASGVWTVGTLASGASETLSVVATVTAHTAITNTATAATTTRDTVPANDTASATVNVPDADLAVTNAVDDATPNVGGNVTFTVTVTNNGPVPGTGVTVAYPLPPGLTFVSATPSAGTYASGSWSVGNLAVGASATLTVVATDTVHTPLSTTATVTGDQYDAVPANNTATTGVNAKDADVSITKTVDDASPEVGQDVTFTITATNAGPDTAAGVSVADALPVGLTLVSATPSIGTFAADTWTIGALANGVSETLVVVAAVTASAPITNTATISTTTFDPVVANDTASAAVDARSADLSVTKSVSDATPGLGANITFTVTVANAGPDAAANVHVADALPGGLTLVSATPSVGTYAAGDWNVGALANGASATLTVVATVGSQVAITNTATVTSNTQDPNLLNNTQGATVNVPDADLHVDKTVTDPTPAIGQNVTFEVTVTNNGPDTATAVQVADTLPSGLSLVSATPSTGTYAAGVWTVGDLADGQAETLSVVATVNDPAEQINSATASSPVYDPAPGDNTDVAVVDVVDVDLAVTNTVDLSTPQVGNIVEFTVFVENQGPGDGTNVQVTYPVPAGLTLISATPSTGSYVAGVWTIGPLAVAGTATMTVRAQVDVNTPLSTTAIVSGDEYDPDLSNNTATANLDAREADIAVTKIVDDAAPALGQNVTFTITVSNNGPDDAIGVTVADALPASLTFVSSTPSAGSYDDGTGVWTLGTLTDGSTETLQITATVTSVASITNTATASATTFDPLTANNSAFATLGAEQADLAVTKTVDNAAPALNGTVTFTIAVRNNGPDAATGVHVADALPAGLTQQSASATQGTYAAGDWNVGTLANGAVETLTVVASVDDSSPQVNTAVVSSSVYDPVPANGTASVTVDVPDTDLAVTNTVNTGAPDVGQDVTFTVTVTNNGNTAATGVNVADLLPAGLTLVSSSATQGTYSGGTWAVGGLVVGQTETLTIVATVTVPAPRSTTATVTGDQHDPVSGNNSMTADVDALNADVQLTKSVTDATPTVGTDVTFTITATNAGPDTARAVAVTDLLPAGLSLVSATASVGTYVPGTGVWSIGDMGNAASEVLTLVATVTGPAAVTNTATAASPTFDTATANNTASAGVDGLDADLSITKTVDTAVPAVGADVTFTVTLTNNGPDAATGVNVADVLPASLTLVSSTASAGTYSGGVWSLGTVASGATRTLTITATVTSHLAATNTATASASTFDPDASDNSASAAVNPIDADLELVKTVDTAAPPVGTDVTYRLTVTNHGPDTATGVVVTDPLPAGLTFVSASGAYDDGTGEWTIGPLASGATATLDITATVTVVTPITNTATVSSTTLDPVPANNTGSIGVDVPDADIAITKSVNVASPAFGTDVTYHLTVTNNGPDAASVTVTDALPSGLTYVSSTPFAPYNPGTGVWNVGFLANGASASLDITATVGDHAAITNTATVTSSIDDPDPSDNSASIDVNVPGADLEVVKSVNDTTPEVGDQVTFTLDVTNHGPDDAAAVSVTDVLPPGLTFVSASSGAYDDGSGVWTIGPLTNGGSTSLDIVATVGTSASVVNGATVTSTTYDPFAPNNSDTETLNPLVADLALTKIVNTSTPTLGANVTFTIDVTNNGPATASGVSVADVLPAGLNFVSASSGAYNSGTGLWTIGSLTSGASATLDIVAQVTSIGAITNSATVTATTYDPNGLDNTDAALVDVPQADVAVAKSASSATPVVGSAVTFTLTATNNGPDTAADVTVTDLLPAGLTFVSASSGAYDSGAGLWTVGSLTSGASATLDIVATVTDHVAITNTATIATTTHDPAAGNNSADATINAPDANLTLTKDVTDGTPAFGTNVTFTLTLTNTGADTAQATAVTDVLPAGLTFVSASSPAYDNGTGVWSVGALPAGSATTLDIVATVNDHVAITNTATATSTTHDPVPADNTDAADVDVPDTDIAVVKSVTDATPAVGANVTFQITVTNNGPLAAPAVTVNDLLPAGLTYVSANPSVGAYDSGTGVWTVGALANGGSEQLDIVATVTATAPVTNTATATGGIYDPVAGNNTDDAQVDAPQTDVAVTKTVSTATPAFGADVTFTVTATNNGPDTADAVTVTDLLPSGLTLVSATPSTGNYASGTGVWNVGTMTNGASATLQVIATVGTHLSTTNTATVATATHDTDASNDSATATVNVRDADLTIAKSVDVAAPVVGTDVNFLVTVTNGGPDTAQSVAVADLLPAGLTLVSATPSTGTYVPGTGAWTVGALASGASATLAIQVTVTTHTPLTNTATVTSTTYDPTPGDHTATADVDAPDADIAVTKSVDNASPQVGDNVVFTIGLRNNGSDIATAASVTDALPAGLTFVSATASTGTYTSVTGVWSVGDLASGATETLTITATVATASGLTNTATGTSSVYDPNPANNAASAAVGPQQANLAVTKTVSDATPVVGGVVTFTVTVVNNGPTAAAAVSVADTLPAGLTPGTITPSVGTYAAGVWTVGTLANGASATLQMAATVTTHLAVTNTAIATSGTFDPDASDNAASRTVDAVDADLSVAKNVSNATPDVGDTVTFTIGATNNGPDDAAGVVVADLLPAGLTFVSATASTGTYVAGTGDWTIGALVNGASATLTVDATVAVRTALTNTATITSTTTDGDPANNSATAGVDARDADVSITKSVDDATPQVGQNVTFTVTVANAGPDTAQAVEVTDVLPAGLTLVSATPSIGTFNSGTGVWTVGAVPNSGNATLTVVATVTVHTAITNTATVTTGTFDPTTGDHTASAGLDARNADLAITKSVTDATPEVGQSVDFTIAVTNNGPDTATAVTVNDLLPAGLTFTSASASAGSYDDGTGVWTVGDLANGTGATLTITATVTGDAPITNTATAGSSTFDPQTSDNTATADVDGLEADLVVTKTVDDAAPALGDTVQFTVSVRNDGPNDATAVQVNDLLPAGLGYVTSSTVTGTYDDITGVWNIGGLANGATAVLTVDATVTTISAATNSAAATSGTFDPDTADNAASATVDVRQVDVEITKSVDTAAPIIGQSVRFTVDVVNNGPDTAAGVVVADTIPAGLTVQSASPSVGTYDGVTWTIGALTNGATATLTVDATVDVDGLITNNATVAASTHDTDGTNNAASAAVDALTADLAVTKSVDNATPAFGTNVTFTVTVTNNGPDDAQNVRVADALPAGLTPVSTTPSTGTYAAGVWSVGTLTNGTSATLTMVATVDTAASVTNTATVSTDSNDTNPANDSRDATVDAPAANLSVSKSVNTSSPSVGSNVTYTVTLTNNGPDTATGVQVDDQLPAGLTFVSATPSTGTYDQGTGVWTVGAMPNGDVQTLSITAQVLTGGGITNTATASATEHDPDMSDNTDSVTISGVRADLEVTKSVNTPAPALGGTVDFTVTITNHGPDDAPATIVDDPLPAGLTFVSATPSVGTYTAGTGVWDLGTLANGATETLTVRATVGSVAAITNIAIGSSAILDPTPADATDSADVNVPDGDLAVTKSVDNATPGLGGDVTYTVTVTNNGPDTATGVQVDDLLPAGLTFVSAATSTGTYVAGTGVWTVGAVGNGASETLTITATVNSAALITNTATVSAATIDGNSANDSRGVDVDVPESDIVVTKTVNDAAPALGANVTFTVTVRNDGPNDAAGVSVTDALPAGLTYVSSTPSTGTYVPGSGVWTVGALGNGASATLDIVATVTSAASITNTATATSTTLDPVTPNTADATVDVPQADLRVSKTVTDATPAAGANVMFTVTVTNDGPNDAAGVSVADALPGGLTLVSATSTTGAYAAGVWTIGALANGGSASLDIVATVTSSASITNTATVSATTFDTDATNNTDAATVNTPDADLSVTKTVNDATPAVGGSATYTITVANNGPDAAPAVQVDDVLPAGVTFASASASTGTYSGGVWTVGTLANGATETLTITVTVTSGALITNTATVSSDAADANPANDSDAVDIDAPDADLAVVKTVDDATPAIGTNVTYTISVTNNGPDSAPAVSVADTLPAGLTFVSASASTGTYAGGVWTIGAMTNGANETLDVVATVTSSALITNTATVSSDAADSDSTNDSDAADVDVAESDLGVVKTVNDAAPALGTDVTFTVTVTNNGPNPATGVEVADALPAGLTLVSSNPSTGAYGSGVWTIGPMASGATETMDVVATVTDPGAITNTATVSATSYDGTSGNNTDSATVDVPEADLAVVKTVSDATPTVNQNVTYRVVVTNNGPATARSVVVTDNLPAGVTFVSASVLGYTGTTWSVGDLANGASATLDIVVEVTSTNAITNTASAAATTFDPDAANNVDSIGLDVPEADLVLTKTVDNAAPRQGEDVTYTLTLTNNGPDTASAIDVTDVLPPELTLVSATPSAGTFAAGVWSVATLANGAAATLAVVARVDAQGTITNTAEVTTAGVLDPTSTPGDGAGDDFDSVDIVAGPPAADLALAMAVSNASPTVGGNVTYTLTLTNHGPSPTDNVSVVDLLPSEVTYVSSSATVGSYDPGSGTWTVGPMASGATVTLTITVRVDVAGAIVNTAEVGSSDEVDPDSSPANGIGAEDDQAERTITASGGVVPPTPADLSIVKSTSSTNVTVGDTVTYAIVVTNNGPGAATNVRVLEPLPVQLQFVSVQTLAGSFNPATGVWSIPSIANGGSATLLVTTIVAAPGAITNTAQITGSDQPDPDGPFSTTPGGPASAQSAATVTARPKPVPQTKLSIKKTGPKKVKAGGTVTFKIVVKNTGTVPATGVVLQDCIPTGLSINGSLVSGRLKSGRISWKLGVLQPGETRVVVVKLRVDRDVRGIRGCRAVAAGANAAAVSDIARIRVIAGAARAPRPAVAG